MGKSTLHATKCVRHMLITCFVFLCQMPCAGTAQCLSDAVPESERQYIQNDQGKDIPVGLFECNWVTSAVMTKMAQIWVEEVLGYHTEIPPQKGTSGASAIWALAGCTSFDDANDKGCGQNETKFHVSMDTWVGSYAAQQEAFLKEYPQIAAIDVGSMGYDGEESIYVSKAIIDQAQQDVGLALTYYQSYNTTHHDPQKYFDSLSDVDPSELALCSDTDFSSSTRMNAYARYSGDYDGMVQQPDGSYFAKCVGPGERWWAAPACRSDLTKCIPTFTASPGWKLQAMMQWTSAYGFPAAIAISNIWANFEKHVRTFRALHYWWVPDSTFIEMQPQPIIFPRHSASEWAAGDKKTGGVGSYISKMVSSNLHSKASLVQDFIGKVQFELLEVQNLLLLHKQSGATTYFDAACNWIKLHRSRWTRWIPDKTQCSAQFGLFNEKTNQFVQSRADQTDLICRACPSGHFSQELQDGLGSGTTHRCVACPVGTSQASGASLACNPCSKGEYQDEEAKSSCKRCEKGRYQGQEGQSQCLQCPPGTTTLDFGSNDLSDCGCNELTINAAPNETTFQCVPCSDGLYCPFSSTIQSLKDGPALANDQTKDFVPVVKEGYYASQENPTSVYLCKPSYFCLRGRPGECGGGLQGVPCAICPDGQTWSEDQCVDCGLAGSPVAWLFGILIGLAGLVALYYMSNTKATEQASPIKVLTMAMGLTVNVMQTVSLMGMMTVTWPREMDAASSGLQFMILDVQSLGLQCFFGSGAVARYNCVAAVFPIMLLWLLTCSLASGFFSKRARHFQPWTWPGTFNVMGLLLQVAFSTVSAVALQPLMCYSHPNGMRSLLKYPNVMCGESAQTSMLVIGLIMGSVFVVAFYVGCIYAAYHMPSWGAKQMTAALLSFRFLSSNFRLNRWWFGLLLLARGFGFCLVIVVATDTGSAQTSLATLILVLYGFSQAIVWPWKAPIINVFDVVLSALLLLLVNKTKTTSQTESANDDWDFSRIFTLLLLLLIAAALATLILVSLGAFLVFYLSPQKNRKNRSTTFINLSKPTSTEAVIRALQQVAEEFSRSERQEIEENFAAMNHYDFKAVVNAIHIISSSVLPMGELPTEMKPSLRVMHSLKSKQSMELGQDPGLQPEPEKMEPEEVASMAATVTESDPPQVEIDPQNEAGSGAGEAAAGSWNLTGLENVALVISTSGLPFASCAILKFIPLI